MVRARIYKPCKTAMQSGRNASVTRGNAWVLEYPRSAVVRPDPLMGWQSSADTSRQVKVRFPDKQSAIAYAEAHGIEYYVTEPKQRKVKPKAYADNFAYTRNGAWTH
ncbi:ETC complex I subunit [Alphaproteobacteria bacterium]|nr:ETC complex I subunit [Alphaproteobacteria bacterium]